MAAEMTPCAFIAAAREGGVCPVPRARFLKGQGTEIPSRRSPTACGKAMPFTALPFLREELEYGEL